MDQIWNSLAQFSPLEWILLGLVALLIFMIWVITHHQESHFLEEPEEKITEVMHALVGSTHGLLTMGNKVELLQDREFFDTLLAETSSAQICIHIEAYMWEAGEASDLLCASLIAARARNVTVRIIVDASGSKKMGKQTRRLLKDAGCHLKTYHKIRIWNLGRLNIRDHRKVVVIDGRVALVGGHCIMDSWFKDQENQPQYRDITARLTGPVVASVQTVFLENWSQATGELFTGKKTYPDLEKAGNAVAHVTYVRPHNCPSSVQNLHYMAIAYAKKSIRIQNPYFLPDPNGVKALLQAAQRGVDVRIMVPALKATDSRIVTRAMHWNFNLLLVAGIRIFEYQRSLLHQKIITIDSEWCAIGSSNFDDRSFEINDEIMVGLYDRETVAKLEEIFQKDAEGCLEVDEKTWNNRPLWRRGIEGALYLVNEQF